MSFDLAVFHSPFPLTAKDALRCYLAVCDDEENLPPPLTPSVKVCEFITELNALYPSFDEISEDESEDSPWSGGHSVSEGHAILLIRYSRADEVGPIILDLTRERGLTLFDPQGGFLYLPEERLSAEERNEGRNRDES